MIGVMRPELSHLFRWYKPLACIHGGAAKDIHTNQSVCGLCTGGTPVPPISGLHAIALILLLAWPFNAELLSLQCDPSLSADRVIRRCFVFFNLPCHGGQPWPSDLVHLPKQLLLMICFPARTARQEPCPPKWIFPGVGGWRCMK